MKKIQLPNDIELSGSFFQFSTPYGKATLERDTWYLSKKLSLEEQKTKIQKILGSICLGCIVKFRGNKEYVISQSYPRQAFTSLQKAVDYLIGKV